MDQPSHPYTYTFPIGVDSSSMQFHVDNANVLKATLEVNGAKLSIVKPAACQIDENGRTSLQFFGERPFHRGLITKCEVNVVLMLEDDRIPTLALELTDDKTISVDDQGHYSEIIVTSGEDADGNVVAKKMRILYADTICGFVAM